MSHSVTVHVGDSNNMRMAKSEMVEAIRADPRMQTPKGQWVFANTTPVEFQKRYHLFCNIRYYKIYAVLNGPDAVLAKIAGVVK